ncbi:MAG: bifunctional riboflavin kinase/FAD synthetase [Dehalococcoidia bacterium]|nr:bifunctional riboflavin kinase/FAD synthetase [Dehalococcoidia bacterium]
MPSPEPPLPKALQELDAVRPPRDTFATIGVFDGVHLGHQALLIELKRKAAQANALSLVITFLNHPRSVLRPDVETSYLCTASRRLALLRTQGVDLLAPITFDLPLSCLRASEFLALLQEKVRVRGLVIGPDFAMGHGREGTADALLGIGRQSGFAVAVVRPFVVGNLVASSTAIRQSLKDGDVLTVAKMLGRPFRLDGTIGHGDHRGKTLGFPTANLVVEPRMALPKDGIYATWTYLGGKRYPSATSIGVRPTFGMGLARTVETFIMDFQGDVYAQPMSLEFAERLRDEQRYESADALVAQMERDVAQARRAHRETGWMLAGSPIP